MALDAQERDGTRRKAPEWSRPKPTRGVRTAKLLRIEPSNPRNLISLALLMLNVRVTILKVHRIF
jgi:hypothetical protein